MIQNSLKVFVKILMGIILTSSTMLVQAQEEGDTTRASNSNQPRIIYYQSSPDKNSDNLYTQRKDKKSDIKTLSGSMNHSGGFAALSFRSTDFRDQTMVLAGFRTGWIVNRTLGIGVEGHGIIPTTKYSDIDPIRDVVALGGYGGMFLELILFSNQVVHVTFPVSAGAGWMGYHTDWENNSQGSNRSQIIDEDVFWYIEPGANVEVNISRNFRLAVGTSRRFTQDFNLINTLPTAFNSPSFYLTLKVGSF